MTKRFSSLLILTMLLVAVMALGVQATNRPVTEKQDPRISTMRDYEMRLAPAGAEVGPIHTGNSVADPYVSLGTADAGVASPGQTIFNSYRDYQHNSTQGRMIDFRTRPDIQFTLMHNPTKDEALAGGTRVAWEQAWIPTSGGNWGATNLVGCKFPNDPARGGYVTGDVDTLGQAVVAFHTTPAPTDPTYTDSARTTVYWTFGGVGNCFWSANEPPVSVSAPPIRQANGKSSRQVLWPKIEVVQQGGVTITHVVAYQTDNRAAGEDLVWNSIVYFRKTGFTSAGTWTAAKIDTNRAGVSPTITASRLSSKVAVVWTSETPDGIVQVPTGTQLDQDVYYRESIDAGLSWGTKVNVTQSDPSPTEGFRAYAEVSALYTSVDDQLHILWPSRIWPKDAYGAGTVLRGPCRLFHWSTNHAPKVINTVALADRQDSLPDCYLGSWTMNMAKASLSECDGRLYAFWVQNNDPENSVFNDCANEAIGDANSSLANTANGDIYMSVCSDKIGDLWDFPRNLTNTRTPNCDTVNGTVGPCQSENWPTVSRYGMDEVAMATKYGAMIWPANSTPLFPGDPNLGKKSLHMQYVEDRYAGGYSFSASNEGIPTLNPIKYLRLPCVTPVPNPILSMRSRGVAFPEWVKHNNAKVVTVILENVGNVTLNITGSSKTQISPVAPANAFTYSIASTTIPAGTSNTTTMTVTLNPAGIINSPGTVVNLKGTITINSNSPVPKNVQNYSIDIPVADTVVGMFVDTVNTLCTKLTVANTGNIGNQGKGKVNLDYFLNGDCDTVDSLKGNTKVYLYDGSPVVIRNKGVATGDTVASWSIFGDGFAQANGFKPVIDKIAPIATFAKSSTAAYNAVSSGQFVSHDSMVAVERTWYAPKTLDSCNFVIEKTLFFPYKRGALPLTNVTNLTLGEAIDWDIPSDTGSINTGGVDDTRNLCWQKGVDLPLYEVPKYQCQKNDTRLGGMAMLGMITQSQSHAVNGYCANDTGAWGGYVETNDAYVYPANGFVPDSIWRRMQIQGFSAAIGLKDMHSVLTFKTGYTLPLNDTLIVYTALASVKSGTLANLQTTIDKAKKWYGGNLRSLQGGGFCNCYCQGTRGNVDGDPADICDISDMFAMIDYLSVSLPFTCAFDEADVAVDQIIDIGDLFGIIDILTGAVNAPLCP